METDKAANAAICFLRSVINTLHAALFLAAIPHQALGQETKSSPAVAVAGGALGLYSGAMLGTVGSIVPCSQTYSGARCVRWSAAVSGTIGLAGGLLVGAADQDRIATAGKSAGIGFLVGSAVGLGLKPFAQRFGWQDVAAVGLLGGAIGASPKGAGIGLGVGAAVAAVLSLSLSDFTFPDVLGTALAGLTIGSLSGWVVDGIDAHTDSDSALHLAFPLTVRF